MSHLSITTFGTLQITLDEHPTTSFATDKVRALLVYLAVEADHAHRRETLAGLLWPDLADRDARHNLSQALWHLRQALQDRTAAIPFVQSSRATVQLNPASRYRLDVTSFTHLPAECAVHAHAELETCPVCLPRLRQAADLYQGEFLQHFVLGHNSPFDEWALMLRERLHQQALQLFATLARLYEQRGDDEQARAFLVRQLELESWREEAHRHLMQSLAQSGQRSAALAQYATCRRILADELGIDPAPATTQIYEAIRAAEVAPAPVHTAPAPSTAPLSANTWLVATKLQPPRLRDDLVPRPRLLTLLYNAVLTHPLTLLSAPAGSGKTTLLAALTAAYPTLPVTWLRLDEDDNDPARFLLALLAALQQINPAYSSTASQILAHLEHPATEARRVIGALINDLAQQAVSPLVLVLDDLHTVSNPAGNAALMYLLDHCPPMLHLVVATRHDPPLALARLRARRQVADLRLDALRFTLDETDQFLNATLGMDLTDDLLALLHARTEGWAAGLALLASSLEHTARAHDRATFLAHLAGTERTVFDFLAEEVLERQDPFVRMFLLETAFLLELTPAVCAAVTGRSDAAAVLDDLYRRNLFLVLREDPKAGAIYRYHDLFRDFLHERLWQEAPHWVRNLYHRAAQAETNPTRAIAYFLTAERWEEAAERIEQTSQTLLRSGAFATVHGWIEALPEAVRNVHPWLVYALGVCKWETFALAEAQALFAQALAGFEADNDRVGQGEALVQLVTPTTAWDDLEQAGRLAERALVCPLPTHRRAHLLVARAFGLVYRGHWQPALADLDAALQLAEETIDPRAVFAITGMFRGAFTALPGGLERCERLIRLLQPHLESPDSVHQTDLLRLNAFMHFWRGDWDRTLAICKPAYELGERLGIPLWTVATIAPIVPLCATIRGDYATAEQYAPYLLRDLNTQDPDSPAAYLAIGNLYWYARMHWMRNNLDAVRQTFVQLSRLTAKPQQDTRQLLRTLLECLLLLAEERYAEAEPLLRAATAMQDRLRFTVIYSDAHLLLAHLYLLQGRPEAALHQFAPVLAESATHNTAGFLMWEGRQVNIPLLKLAKTQDVHADFAAHVLRLLDTSQRAPTEK